MGVIPNFRCKDSRVGFARSECASFTQPSGQKFTQASTGNPSEMKQEMCSLVTGSNKQKLSFCHHASTGGSALLGDGIPLLCPMIDIVTTTAVLFSGRFFVWQNPKFFRRSEVIPPTLSLRLLSRLSLLPVGVPLQLSHDQVHLLDIHMTLIV